MILHPQEDFAALRSIVGARLLGLSRDQYLFNGQPSSERDDGNLEMRFDGGRVVTLSLASDGDSVRAVPGALEIKQPFKLDSAAMCAWERVDLEQSPDFGNFIGRPVAVVEAIIDTWINLPGVEVVSGWVIRFAGDDFVTYQNVGDASRILLNELMTCQEPAIHSRIGWHE